MISDRDIRIIFYRNSPKSYYCKYKFEIDQEVQNIYAIISEISRYHSFFGDTEEKTEEFEKFLKNTVSRYTYRYWKSQGFYKKRVGKVTTWRKRTSLYKDELDRLVKGEPHKNTVLK